MTTPAWYHGAWGAKPGTEPSATPSPGTTRSLPRFGVAR
jgi:hypothetical protein